MIRLVAVWLLRALFVWGMLEGGQSAYTEARSRLAQLDAVAANDKAAVASVVSAERLQSNLRRGASAGKLAIRSAPAESGAIAAAMRDTLLVAGAEAPVVEAQQDSGLQTGQTMTFRLVWRERLDLAPGAVHALRSQFSNWRVRSASTSVSQSTALWDVTIEGDAR